MQIALTACCLYTLLLRTQASPTFVLQKVIIAPFCAVAVGLPLLVNVQQRQVITLWHKELLSR